MQPPVTIFGRLWPSRLGPYGTAAKSGSRPGRFETNRVETDNGRLFLLSLLLVLQF